MEWKSINDIVKDLNLSSSADDLEGVKHELLALIIKLHPDKNGGEFDSIDAKQRYLNISRAYDYVINLLNKSHAVMRTDEILPSVIQAIREAQIIPEQTQIIQLSKECREENRSILSSNLVIPRIGSSVFAAICASLFTFSSSLQNNPILGPVVKSTAVQILLLVFAIYAGIFFIFTWVGEHQQQALLDYLMSESGRQDIFHHFFKPSRQFSLQELIQDIRVNFRRRISSPGGVNLLFFPGYRNIAEPIVEKIAKIHLLELEHRGAIHRINTPSMESWYKFDESLTDYL